MALLLHLETTTKVCSVALTENGKVLALKESNAAEYNHAEQLNVFIAEVMAISGKEFSQLDAISIAEGPGSYTGLRIGVSSAKGLCFALDKPLIALNPLEALTKRFLSENTALKLDNSLVIPMIDARRDEVFMSTYSADNNTYSSTKAEIIDQTYFEQQAYEHFYLIGDGAAKFEAMFSGNAKVSIYPNCIASARYNGIIAEQLFNESKFVDLAYFEPYYGKEFQTTTKKPLNRTRTKNE